MHKQQRQQTSVLLGQHGIEQAIFARPDTIKWLTGFAPAVQTGLNTFSANYPIIWYSSGKFTLIIVDGFAQLATEFAKESDGAIVTYQGYTIEQPIESGKNLLAAFDALIGGKVSKLVGVETEYVSDLIAARVRKAGGQVVAVDHWLEPLRMIKTGEEIAKLRRNFELGDIGHAAARQAAQVGQREIDVWDAMHTAIEGTAGCRVAVGNDCVVGYRDFNIGGWPEALELRNGDSIIVDISAIKDGYWSDSCATYFAGERSQQQRDMLAMITDALEFGKSLLKPGAVCKEIDQKMRAFVEKAGYPVYPHHTGHGVGASAHEAPRIVPYSEEVLQPGMVIMLEPGTYIPGKTGVRLEDGYLITENGCEVLTKHDKS